MSPEVTVKGSESAVCTMHWMGLIDGDIICNGSEEDRKVRSYCEGDEGTDCADGGIGTDW